MATISRLNSMKQITPTRTGKHGLLDEQNTTARKRRAIADDLENSQTKSARLNTRQSVSRLRSRTSLPASTPTRQPRTAEIYEVQESPKNERKTGTPAIQPPKETKDVKKKRLLNRKGEKKTVETDKFDKRRRSAFDPLTVSGVTLSTADSPAKNTRAKRELPLKKLHPDYLKPIPINAETTDEQGLAEGLNTSEAIPSSPKRRSRQSAAIEENDVELEEEVDGGDDDGTAAPVNEIQQSARETAVNGRSSRRGSDSAEASEVGTIHPDEPAEHDQTWVDRPTDQDRNFMRKQFEEAEKELRRKPRESNTEQQAPTPKTRKSISKQQKQRNTASQKSREQNEDETHDAQTHDEANDEGAGSGRKRGRQKKSEAEKRAEKEAKAKQRQENAVETAEAESRDFAAYAEDFVEGIEQLLDEVGGKTTWSKLGAGAKMITSMVSKKKEMDEARGQVLWLRLGELNNIFLGKQEANEERISHLLKNLQINCTWKVLTRNNQIKQGDRTIIDLYERIIPMSVYLMKAALKERFVPRHIVSWQELQSLTEIALNICNVAKDWRPRPSLVETGIPKQVHQNIKPGLAAISAVIKDTIAHLELKERRKRELASFVKLQQRKKEEKQLAWERLNRECPSRQFPKPAGYVPSNRTGQHPTEENEVMDDSEGDESVQSEPLLEAPYRRPRGLLRQPTEEIPAPDPSTNWSERENVALLNGLQRYLGVGRYTKILHDAEFAKVLTDKDVDQCMARAKFYQAGFGQVLKEKLEQGDNSFDWLRTV